MLSYLKSCVSEVEAEVEDKKETPTKIVDVIRKEEEAMKTILEKNQQTISTLRSIV
jgi:chaperonin cofactor prefoldin